MREKYGRASEKGAEERERESDTLDGLMDIGKNAPSIAIFYNPETHLLMAASVKIALITCLRVINEIYTDGFTHSKTVTKVLYNPLYKTILTVSKDSTIIAWEPFIGRCLFTINHAHTKMELGESKDLPITAAEFDPSKVLLITGSNDGSMKVWNFNEKKCVRNMTTGDDSRVVDIHWISNRVLVMTWHHITEFVYPEGTIVGKTWEAKHTDDLTACAVCPHAFVTGTFNGELIFWRLETGQSLKGFIIVDPEKSKVTELSLKTIKSRKRKDVASDTHSIVLNTANVTDNDSIDSDMTDKSQSDLEVNYYNFESSLLTNHWKSDVTIHAITYLRGGTRLAGADEGVVLVSTNGGFVQMWSTHRSAASGLVYTFKATRDPDVYIMTMATDRLDQYLFTGDSIGYIRIFSILNLGVPESDRVQIDHMYFYHKFPYYAIVNPDMNFENVAYPILLSCYQGHKKTVTSLNFIQELEVLVSSSTDNSARLWTLEGQYIGTLGNTKYWKQLERNTKAEVVEPRLPPDIRRVCSENTLKVLSYKSTQDFLANVDTVEDDLSNLPVDKIPTYGKPLSEPILGNYFSLPERGKRKIKLPKVDATKGRFVRVYALMANDDKPLKEVASLKNSKPKRGKERDTTPKS
ncbi:WD repeat-containing protein on Y chromosome-like [Nilaparvata lugens]|uniref:WD repeat-containing protein on Y chromosome-like n=1 Tax=Nilaparvata lugens TaxID=108931 RepID=UPI00193D8631|nr:WD repeat-containing protein on Y chromosome-like [Nilaparvata lugens]